MHTTAIYRLLYGSDFIGESLSSIYDHVDQVLCFVGHEMFGGLRIINYFGHDVYLPHDIDGLTDAINAWKSRHDHENKVHILANPYATLLKCQVQRMVNEVVIPRHPQTSHVLFVESDEVWHEDAIAQLLSDARASEADEFLAQPLLFWKSPKYVSARFNPYCVLRALRGRRHIGPTGHALMSSGGSGAPVVRSQTNVKVHNFGFAAAERTIFWKHLTALSFSRDAKLDDPPREEWFEDVWRPWNWHTNRRTDLCPSIGHETAFSAAVEYPTHDLPKIMRDRIARAPLKEWALAENEPAAAEARP